jgi:hypothetical protein
VLGLDKSSAWRRLSVARDKGYVVNLETRRGQPGRYRLTEQEVEALALMPAPEALSGGSKTAQPRNPRSKDKQDQKDDGCTDARNRDAIGARGASGCEPVARPHATVKPLEKYKETVTGCAVAPVSGGSRQIDLEEAIAEAIAATPAPAPVDLHAELDDIPTHLERRPKKRVCTACDGLGCPTCQPRRFGIGS